ncbi:MAG: hypothetical protein AAGI17_02715 [Planctomycetota bacterium]
MSTRTVRSRPLAAAVAAALAVTTAFSLGGCALFGFIAYTAENARRTGSTTYPADYDGLTDKTYAVVVEADRVIQAEHPSLVPRLIDRVNTMIHDNAGASQYIPSDRIVRFIYDNPTWQALSRGELAERLGVERLIVVEVLEYRHHSEGNPYIWEGVASAITSVFESDSGIPDDPSFQRSFIVSFPDNTEVLRESIPEAAVRTELTNRVARRAAWLFYEHDEPNSITY